MLIRLYSANLTDKMKKLKFCFCLILLISCENFETSQEDSLSQTQSYLEEIEELKSLYVQGIDLALDALDNKKTETKHNDNSDWIEEVVFMDIVNVMAKEIIVFKNGGKNEFQDEYERIIGRSNTQARLGEDMLNGGNFYSVQQTEILNPFINASELTDNPFHSKNIAQSFQSQIINSTSLNYDEKIRF